MAGSEKKLNHTRSAPLQTTYRRDTSSERSTAGEWFVGMKDDANTGLAAFADGEPSFFSGNSVTESIPLEVEQHRENGTQESHTGSLSDPIMLDRDGSGEDDFHGIIDDLVIENKELQRELRVYKRLHHTPVHEDALFKVHVHSLLPEKKQDFMCLLQDFVRTNIVQKLESISTTKGPAVGVHIVRKTATDSIKDRESSTDDQKGHWKGRSNIERCISDSSWEEHRCLAPFPQSDANDTQNPVTGSERQTKATSQHGGDGTIIFYDQAGFYTDLSGDIGSSSVKERSYNRFSADPIGARTHLESLAELRRLEYEKGPLSQPDTDTVRASGSASILVMNEDDWEALTVGTSCQSSSLSNTSDSPRFEVSGLGGIVPSDHFSITIHSCLNARTANVISPTRTAQDSRPYRHHVRGALEDRPGHFRSSSTLISDGRSCLVVQRDIVGFQVQRLHPSCLPPPSYYEYESSEGDEESNGSEHSVEENEESS